MPLISIDRPYRLLAWLLGCLLLAACGTSQPAAAPDAPEAAATSTSVAAVVATPAPTVTVLPPSPEPSATPAPTVTVLPPSPEPLREPPPTPTPGLDEEVYARLGSPDAPVTIYEFSDFGCPACRQFALFTFPTLREEFIASGQVQFIFKDYPIVSQQGGLAAQAAECAGEQGAYWEMHDQLFRNPSEWNTTPEGARATFGNYAAALGLDAAALTTCLAEERYKADVDRDVEEALEIGWFGTPTFFINRKLLAGAQPPDVFREVIERELASIGSE